MQVRVTHGWRSGCSAAGVAELLPVEHVFVDVMLHEEPGALVLRLVLAPDDVGRVRVLLQLGREGLVREGVELLNTDDGNVGGLLLGTCLDEVVIDLARADDDALDLDRKSTRLNSSHRL